MWPFNRKSQPAASNSLPDGLIEALDAAYRSGGKFVVIVAHYDGTVAEPNRYWRRANNFPAQELPSVIDAVKRDLEEERQNVSGRNGQARRLAIPRR